MSDASVPLPDAPSPAPLGAPPPAARRRAPTLARLACVVLGAVLELLVAPPGPAPALVFVMDAPFLVLLFTARRRWAAWAFVYGFARFATGLWWLWYVNPWMIVGAAAVLAGVWTLWGLVLRAGARRRVPFLPLVAVTAVGEEMLQACVMGASGMPWPARSLAFAAWPDLVGFSAYFGAYGLSALAAATSAWASGLPGLLRDDGFRAARVRGLVASGVLLALAGGAAWFYGAASRGFVAARLEGPGAPAARTDPLVIVQASILQDMKNAKEQNADDILARHLRRTTEALERLNDEHQRALAVLWPETMIPWPFVSRELAQRFPHAFEAQHSVLRAIRDAVPAGQPSRFLLGVNHYFVGAKGPQAGLYDHDSTDAVVYVDLTALPDEAPDPMAWPADGRWPWEQVPGRHEKVVLVPWGEYTPGGTVLPFLRTLRDGISIIPEITPGDPDQAPFQLGWAPPERPGGPNRAVLAGSIVCFEVAFPSRCRAWRQAGATVLLNAGNYGWYGDSTMPAQVLALAKLRAAETAVTVVIAGNTGPSCIVDPSGRLRTQVLREGRTQFVEGWCAGPLYADPGYETLYLRWGNTPWAVAAGGLLLAAFLGRRRVRDEAELPSGPSVGRTAAGGPSAGADATAGRGPG
ncbi:MAG: apolipoprotein N-acyltransferase [Planctomycetota bacterium]